MQGILLVDKPRHWTSFDVVNYIRKILSREDSQRPKLTKLSAHVPKIRVGHTGTLDPLATGLLVLLIGSYTKRAPELTKLDKTYKVAMKLGETSTTADAEGEKTQVSSLQPARADIEKVLKRFTGETMQTPPAYSAVKVNGQRAYKLAREGKTVGIEPRKVTVHSLRLTAYDYPFVKFTASVSSGTYIRTLVEDIGRGLNTGAYMSDLCRTTVGPFNLSQAQAVEGIDMAAIADKLRYLPNNVQLRTDDPSGIIQC